MQDSRGQFISLMARLKDPLLIEKLGEQEKKYLPDQARLWHQQLAGAELFEIELVEGGNEVSEVEDTYPFISPDKNFYIPYDHVGVATKGNIKLSLKFKDKYVEQTLIAFSIKKVAVPQSHKMALILKNQKVGEWYDCYIYSMISGFNGVNTQDCVFGFVDGRFYLPEHLGMCADTKNCSIGIIGTQSKDGQLCEEISARRVFVHRLIEIFSEINKPRPVIQKEKSKPHIQHNPKREQGNHKGEIGENHKHLTAKDIIIDAPRYVYNEKSTHGKGGKHKIRYTVRRHLRIQNNRIVWVTAHEKGEGDQVIRWHRKKSVITISKYQRFLEAVTTHRSIEPLLVRVIKYLRGQR